MAGHDLTDIFEKKRSLLITNVLVDGNTVDIFVDSRVLLPVLEKRNGKNISVMQSSLSMATGRSHSRVS